MTEFFDTWKWWLIGAGVLVVAGIGFYIWWSNKRKATKEDKEAEAARRDWDLYREQLQQQQQQQIQQPGYTQPPPAPPGWGNRMPLETGRMPAPMHVEKPGTYKPGGEQMSGQMPDPTEMHVTQHRDLRPPPQVGAGGYAQPSAPTSGNSEYIENPNQPYQGQGELVEAFTKDIEG